MAKAASSRRIAAVSEEPSDQLVAVANARDRAAFGRLFEHYKDRAYNLAYHITGRAEAAEEAVQEAMLRVWTAAATFKPGNADGWVLRIVARESLKVLRTRKKDRKEMAIEREREHVPRETAPGEDLERDELLAGLRGAIAGLDPAARRLVALYFGAGMTQEEIAQELELSQRGVSYKIDEALAALKRRLAQAGLAAAVPMLNAQGLGEAICTGARAPAGIENAVFQSLGQALRESVKHSVRGASSGGSVLGWTIAAVLVAGGAGGAWYFNETSAPVTSAPAAKADAQTEAPAGVKETPATNQLKLPLKWTFETGVPKDFRQFYRDWKKVVPAQDGLPARLVPGFGANNSVYILLPKGLPSRPFVIVVETSLNTSDLPEDFKTKNRFALGLNAMWAVGTEGGCVRQSYGRQQSLGGLGGSSRETWTHYAYVLGRFIFLVQGVNGIYDLNAFKEPYPSEEICLSVNGFALESIEVREIEERDLPPVLKDWRRLGEEIENGARAPDGWRPKPKPRPEEIHVREPQ